MRRQLLNYGKRESTDLRWKFGSLCGREIECSAGSAGMSLLLWNLQDFSRWPQQQLVWVKCSNNSQCLEYLGIFWKRVSVSRISATVIHHASLASSEAKESASQIPQKYLEVRPMLVYLVVMLKIAESAGYTLWICWNANSNSVRNRRSMKFNAVNVARFYKVYNEKLKRMGKSMGRSSGMCSSMVQHNKIWVIWAHMDHWNLEVEASWLTSGEPAKPAKKPH